jgi:ABC-type phosphate transport system substrate-binding protein
MRLKTALSAIAVLLATFPMSGEGPTAVAIIVNKASSVDTLSARDVKQIFSGVKKRWPDGQRITTLGPGPDAPEHAEAVQFFFGMSETEYRKYCIQATFTGNTDQVPKEYASSQAAANLVQVIPGAIAFVRADVVSSNVKLVKIDNKAPGEPGYPLAGAK